jgi:hypothetical protein
MRHRACPGLKIVGLWSKTTSTSCSQRARQDITAGEVGIYTGHIKLLFILDTEMILTLDGCHCLATSEMELEN